MRPAGLRTSPFVRRRTLVGLAVAAVAATVLAVVLALVGSGRSFDYNDPFDRFPEGGRQGTNTTLRGAPGAQSQTIRFLSFVASDIQGFWHSEFRRSRAPYEPAQVVVFRAAVRSGCGLASSATGPFYCPVDRRVYVDLGFFHALAREFHAPGDFAEAYVIAHEFGHHVQNLTGVMGQVQRAMDEGLEPSNELSIRLELQADCLAGVWAHSTYERGLLERGDLTEGLRAAAAVGDDRVQARTTGRIDPETWTHGSSEQRARWFARGFRSGDPGGCDTFSDGL